MVWWQIVVMWRATPLAPYGLVVSLVVAALLARPVARRLETSAIWVGAWLLLVGVIVTLTMTPGLGSGSAARWCSLQVSRPPTLTELFAFHERGLNAWMYVPPALLAVLPRRRRAWVTAVATTAVLPFVAEAVQWAFPAMGRLCQSQDVVANLTGVVIGTALGLAVRVVVREVVLPAGGEDVRAFRADGPPARAVR